MSLRALAGVSLAALALLAPAAHADLTRVCARAYGSAVPAGLRGWQCVGGSTQKPGCVMVAAHDPSSGATVAGVEVCGLV